MGISVPKLEIKYLPRTIFLLLDHYEQAKRYAVDVRKYTCSISNVRFLFTFRLTYKYFAPFSSNGQNFIARAKSYSKCWIVLGEYY